MIAIASALLDWYDRNRRHLPWRFAPGKTANPYWVWLSEIMLQQTTVGTVGPYFHDFINRWPKIQDLADAPREDILKRWAGLGYYARARNLHKCAVMVRDIYSGQFPDSYTALLKLPGIGPYTAAAISAIAFQQPETVMDGNIERVIARLFNHQGELPGDKKGFYQLAKSQTPDKRPGDYAQAMMDLGATICTPRKPRCEICPLEPDCRGKSQAENLPRKAAKKIKPTRYGYALYITDDAGRILLRRRPDKGLLGGMSEIPGSDWTPAQIPANANFVQKLSPVAITGWQIRPEVISHSFTHFHLELNLVTARLDKSGPMGIALPGNCFWVSADRVELEALPTVMKKAVRAGRKAERENGA